VRSHHRWILINYICQWCDLTDKYVGRRANGHGRNDQVSYSIFGSPPRPHFNLHRHRADTVIASTLQFILYSWVLNRQIFLCLFSVLSDLACRMRQIYFSKNVRWINLLEECDQIYFCKDMWKVIHKILRTTCLYNHMQSFAVKMTQKNSTLLIYYYW
jgi:hypothetical protein